MQKGLDTKEGQRAVFRIAKQMADERKDIIDMKCLKSENGEVLTEPHAVNGRWRHYMDKLLNVENDWDRILAADIEREVEGAVRNMKVGKAAGPSEIVVEMLKADGNKGVKIMTKLCNHVVREGAMPKEWELSTLIPIYKGKGDPMECGSYRAIKLLEHGMKVLERVLEWRLRMTVNIDDMQFGFMSEKGTVDAIFIVRQLQEKFMEKRKDLFYAFVDLEKAFDRVLRDVVRWALRQLGVKEWLVQTVVVMYEKARTTVRTKQGNSEEFEVKVGVHQGSVLSPLLFVAVIEIVTRKVREGLPWELLYADDLVLVAQSVEKVQQWKACMESKGPKMLIIDMTKVMRSEKDSRDIVKTGK